MRSKKIVLQRGEIFPFLLFAPHNEHNEKSLSSQGKKLLKRIGEKIHLINWKGWLFATAWNFPFLSVSHPIQFSLMSKENTFIHPIQSINENNTRRNTLNTWLGKKRGKTHSFFYLTGLVNLLNWQWQKDRYYYKSTQKWNSTQGPIKEKCFAARVSLLCLLLQLSPSALYPDQPNLINNEVILSPPNPITKIGSMEDNKVRYQPENSQYTLI